jgi:hypothetical protein
MMFPRPKFKLSHTWTVSAIATTLVTIGIIAEIGLFPVKKLVSERPEKPEPFMRLQKPADYADAVRDQSILMDPAPLFLPTTWNTARAGHVISGRLGVTELSEAFRPEIEIEAGMIAPRRKTEFPSVTAYSSKFDDSGAMMKMGRDTSVKSSLVLPARGASYIVVDDESGKVRLSGRIDQSIPEAGDLLWQPAEFWIRVAREGVSGTPLLSGSSGSDTLDSALRKIIDGLSSLASLDPGYYKIVVGP